MTRNTHFPWKRYWLPATDEGAGNGQPDGFLHLPDPDLAPFYPGLDRLPKALESLADKKVLVLLGAPGGGKSDALRQEYQRLKTLSEDSVALSEFIQLGNFGAGEQEELAAHLFRSAAFKNHLAGKTLWLFLDGLDECPLTDRGVPWLQRQLQTHIGSPERVHLRITCRAADWTPGLEDSLRQIWASVGDDAVSVLHLCQLQETDLRLAAEQIGLDAAAFLNQIHQRDVAELAAIPATAVFMLELAKRDALPDRKTEIYRQGLELLCDDAPSRQHRQRRGNLSPRQRFVLAARIATATKLGGKTAISERPAQGNTSALPLDDLLAWRFDSGFDVHATRDQLLETLQETGIFVTGAGGYYRFVSQTFCEFLTAWYIAEHGIATIRLAPLFEDSETALIPSPLHETAAWMAAFHDGFRDWLFGRHPMVALSVDQARLDIGFRPQLLASLLDLARHNHLTGADWRKLARLAHPELADQLAPVIADGAATDELRGFAIRIADACECCDLAGVIVKIALDATQSHDLRLLAIGRLKDLAPPEQLAPLQTLLAPPQNDPQQQEMVAATLAALGIEGAGAGRFFAVLTPQLLEKGSSELHSVIYDHSLVTGVGIDGLVVGLAWVRQHASKLPSDWLMTARLREALLAETWKHIEENEHLRFACVDTLIALRAVHSHFFQEWARSNQQTPHPFDATPKRRAALATLCAKIKPEQVADWVYYDESIIRIEDVDWLLDRIGVRPFTPPSRVMAAFIAAFLGRNVLPLATLNRTLELALPLNTPENPLLAQALSPMLSVWMLDDPATLGARENWRRWQQLKEERRANAEARRLPHPPEHYVLQALARCEAGEFSQWPELAFALTFTEGGERGFPFHPAKLHGWQTANDTVRQRIAVAGLSYLGKADPPDVTTCLSRSHTVGERAGGFAIEVLGEAGRLADIPAQLWQRWMLPVMAYLFESHDLQTKVFGAARSAASDAFDATALLVLDHQAEEGHLHLLQALRDVWHPHLEERLAQRLDANTWPLEVRLQLAEALLALGRCQVLDALPKWLAGLPDADHRLAVALALFRHTAGAAWDALQELIESDPEEGKRLLLAVGREDHGASRTALLLDARQMSWLFTWLTGVFPESGDPVRTAGAHWRTTRDDVASFRSGLVSRIADLGTPDGLAELDKLITCFPEQRWIRRARARSVQVMADKLQPMIAPEHVFQLLRSPLSRIVRSDLDLLDVVMEALAGFARDAQEPPHYLVSFLWDERQQMPVREQRLSDFLRFYLDREWRGSRIVVNREVQVRNLHDFGIGERTDLLIQALPPAGSSHEDSYTVIVEVKHDRNCTNQDIPHQLANYLNGRSWRCGVYLVGWFGAPDQVGLQQNRFEQIAEASAVGTLKISALVMNLHHQAMGAQSAR